MNPIIDTIIEDQRWEGCCDADALANAAVQAVLSNIEASWSGELEISFLFCDDEKIRSLNATWNDKDTTLAILQPVSIFILAAIVLDADALMSARTIDRSASKGEMKEQSTISPASRNSRASSKKTSGLFCSCRRPTKWVRR